MEKEKPKENLVPENGIVFTLPKIPEILNNGDFEQKQEIKKQQDDEINNGIDLNRLRIKLILVKSLKKLSFILEVKTTTFFSCVRSSP